MAGGAIQNGISGSGSGVIKRALTGTQFAWKFQYAMGTGDYGTAFDMIINSAPYMHDFTWQEVLAYAKDAVSKFASIYVAGTFSGGSGIIAGGTIGGVEGTAASVTITVAKNESFQMACSIVRDNALNFIYSAYQEGRIWGHAFGEGVTYAGDYWGARGIKMTYSSSVTWNMRSYGINLDSMGNAGKSTNDRNPINPYAFSALEVRISSTRPSSGNMVLGPYYKFGPAIIIDQEGIRGVSFGFGMSVGMPGLAIEEPDYYKG